MRTLYLLRHAKSSWKDESLADFDRPLNQRGRESAELVGKYLARQKINLSSVVCSPAVRTRETIQLVLKSAAMRVDVSYDERIYEAGVGSLLKVIEEIADDHTEVLLVGHNLGIQDLLTYQTGEHREMKTAALAKITFETSSWAGIKRGTGQLELFVTPKDLVNLQSSLV